MPTRRRAGFAACLVVVAALATALAGQQPQGARQGGPPRGPARDIVQIAPDLYRAHDGNWWTIFLVTPAGIILGDPINLAFAGWLKPQLDNRFPGVPVRYVVYSHSHYDHASGGEVFAATATFVAHINMARNMDGRYPGIDPIQWTG